MKRKLPFSCYVQNFLATLGIAIHNPFRNECTKDFGCCTNIGKYWLRINQDAISKVIKHKNYNIEYASRYSKIIWKELMDKFDNDPNFYIGANDVSDYVLNAILDALDGYKEPRKYNYIESEVECNPADGNTHV